MKEGGLSPYYKDAGRIPVSSLLSHRARKQIFDFFMCVMGPNADTTVLDIGVTSDAKYRESNLFEQLYPYKNRIVCVGTEDGSHLERLYPGIRFIRVKPHAPLPFPDKCFDVVFSNAVIEHVGSAEQQRAFISEACRVGRWQFVVTPNRWFPIEHHTAIPLLHYMPQRIYRRVIARTWLRYWSLEENLNLLTEGELRRLFPVSHTVKTRLMGIGYGPFKSNIVAYSSPEARS